MKKAQRQVTQNIWAPHHTVLRPRRHCHPDLRVLVWKVHPWKLIVFKVLDLLQSFAGGWCGLIPYIKTLIALIVRWRGSNGLFPQEAEQLEVSKSCKNESLSQQDFPGNPNDQMIAHPGLMHMLWPAEGFFGISKVFVSRVESRLRERHWHTLCAVFFDPFCHNGVVLWT